MQGSQLWMRDITIQNRKWNLLQAQQTCERDLELENLLATVSDKNNNLLFILNEGGNHSRIFYLEEFLVLLLHVYRHENSLIYFCLQLFFISSTLLLPAIWQNQSVSSSHFQRRGGTGFKSPNVSRENPLEPRLQNSIWHTNCVYVSARIIFFWSYLTFENWEFGMALLKFTSIFTIQFHDLDLSMHAYYHSRQNFTSRTTYKR